MIDDIPMRAEKKLYRRWHGAGLLTLAYLGFLGIREADSHTRGVAFKVNGLFHVLASSVGFLALLDQDPGEKKEKKLRPGWDLKKALLNPHNLLAIGFGYVTYMEGL